MRTDEPRLILSVRTTVLDRILTRTPEERSAMVARIARLGASGG